MLLMGITALVFFGCKNENLQPKVTSNATGGSQSSNVYGIPSLSSPGATLESIDITFTAGTYGAPSGFTIQWMTKAQFDAIGDVWPTDTNAFCKGSFSGNAFMSRYNLKNAGDTVTVRIGDLLYDNGASSNCNGDLLCGTTYVFRAFSHGDNKKNRSGWSAILTASTLPCPTGTCVHGGLGYWKNISGGVTAWPGYVDATTSLTLGTNSYTYQQCMDILNHQDGGNGLVIVAHQLIPALLNQLSGAPNYNLTAAQTYIGSNLIPPVGTAKTTASSAAGLVSTINAGDHTCH
jgi:hypothetical protein